MALPTEFELRCGDVRLLSFELGEDALGTPYAALGDIDGDKAHLLPWGLSLSDAGVFEWLQRRALPHNRANARRIAAELGFRQGDLRGAYAITLGLSLNDSYWTPPAGYPGGFADVNLYENGFSEALFSVAFDGRGTAHPALTPEFTTNGTLRKAWRVDAGGARVLCKGGTEGWVPGEPASEVIVSSIAVAAGLDAVRYGMEERAGDELMSVCECFCSPSVSFSPFACATGVTDLTGTIAFAGTMGDDSVERLADMLVLDALVANTDRHFGNFGLLRDSARGGAIGFAPIFDNGRGLLPRLRDEELPEASYELATLAPAFGGGDFGQLASRVIGEEQLDWIERLAAGGLNEALGETAMVYPRLSGRAGAIRGILSERLDALRRLPPVDHRALARTAREVVAGREPAGRPEAAHRVNYARAESVPPHEMPRAARR